MSFDLGDSTRAGAAPEEQYQERALDGRDGHGDRRLPPPAVRDGRSHDLPAMRPGGARDSVEGAARRVLAAPGMYHLHRAVRDRIAIAGASCRVSHPERISSPVPRRDAGRDRRLRLAGRWRLCDRRQSADGRSGSDCRYGQRKSAKAPRRKCARPEFAKRESAKRSKRHSTSVPDAPARSASSATTVV